MNRENLSRTRARVMLLVLATGAVFWVVPGAQGVPACPEPIVVKQPDGTAIRIHLKGDEFFHWHEDDAGNPILKSQAGVWVYAKQDQGQLAPTDLAVGAADPKMAGLAKPDVRQIGAAVKKSSARTSSKAVAPAPKTGTMKNLVVLVNFSDLTVAYSNQAYTDLFNQIGYTADGASGSVKDFYNEISYNQLNVDSVIAGPVTLNNGFAYYGANDAYGNDLRPREMVSEALAKLNTAGFDFTTVDNDHDGWVDGLTIIHAGGGEEYSGNNANYIWSHQWELASPVTYDGVQMKMYHTEPARRGWDSVPSSQGITRIGVVCHENGHFLGLPDLYDYGYDSEGAGNFCLMAGGSWNGDAGTRPAHMSAWCKSTLTWLTPTVISATGDYSLGRVETNQQVYKLQGSFPSTQYFLMENRQGAGFDAGLPGSSRGILIWHVDETVANNDNQTHYKVDLEEASGTQHLELNSNAGDDADYYRSGNNTSFTSATSPNNLSYSGTNLGMNVTNVSATGATMTFHVDATLPSYCTASGGCSEYISRVQVGTIDNSSTCGNYSDYTAQSTSMTIGMSYSITVTTGSANSADQCGIWVDWNQDKDFGGAGEALTVSGSPGVGPYTASIVPPAGALTGPTRMRVRITRSATPSPCGTSTYGEVEDYTINVFPAPSYCSASGGSCDEYIYRVQVGTINNTSGCNVYSDYTALSTTMSVGTSYPITVTNGLSYLGDVCGIWVDWNQDKDFSDTSETISVSGGPGTFTANIAPPASALSGPTRMRVRILYNDVVSPCGTTTYGEVEDYTINVSNAPPTPSNPSVSYNPCGPKTLTRANPPAGVTWYWQGTSCGTSTSLGSGVTYTANTSGTYYIRARKDSSGTWSDGCGSAAVTVTIRAPGADLDYDCDVDGDDFKLLEPCILGAAIPRAAGCQASDFDGDGDVDQADYGVFQRCFSGSGNPANMICQ